MVLSRKGLPVIIQIIVAALSVVASLLLALSSPDVGRAPNPFIALAVYILPVLACMMIANAAYVVVLDMRGLPTRNLAETLVYRVLRHWHDQDARRLARETSEPESNPEIEQRPDP
ncbi:MAG: hypothetical protein AB1384_08935 [Actinomycetota bacterium]